MLKFQFALSAFDELREYSLRSKTNIAELVWVRSVKLSKEPK
jgi:hypothetical protein